MYKYRITKYHLLEHNSRYFTTRLIRFHNIRILNIQNTISSNQSIQNNTQALCSRYTKTQSYMQCGTMLVKNLKTLVANAKCIHPIFLSCGGKETKHDARMSRNCKTVWTLSKSEIITEESKNERTKGVKERCTSNTISLTKSKPKQHTGSELSHS